MAILANRMQNYVSCCDADLVMCDGCKKKIPLVQPELVKEMVQSVSLNWLAGRLTSYFATSKPLN